MAWDASIFMSRQGAHAEPVPSSCHSHRYTVSRGICPSHSNSVRNFNSLSILYVVQYTATAGRIFNPPKLRCCDGFPIRYHPIGKLLVDSYLGGPHGTPVVYPDDGSAPLARGFSI